VYEVIPVGAVYDGKLLMKPGVCFQLLWQIWLCSDFSGPKGGFMLMHCYYYVHCCNYNL